MKPVLIHNRCHYCGEEMTWDKFDFLRCPVCEAESHPPELDTEKSIKKTVLKAVKPPKALDVRAKSGKKGGSKSKGRSTAKEKMKRQPTGVLFQRLFVNT